MLDVGCGWGGLAIHAARSTACACSASPYAEQSNGPTNASKATGLGDRCQVEFRDYRQVNEPEAFDKISAIGCMEHIGEVMLPVLAQASDAAAQAGRGLLNHAIARGGLIPHGSITSSTVTSSRTANSNRSARRCGSRRKPGFEVRDVECLPQYTSDAETLAATLSGECGSSTRTHQPDRVSHLAVLHVCLDLRLQRWAAPDHYQSLLWKPTRTPGGLPLTRDDWYP